MCDSRMWTLKLVTCGRLTHIKTSFSFPIYLKMGTFPPSKQCSETKNGKKVQYFFQFFFQVKNIVAETFHGDNTTMESQRLNSIQESEYTNHISFYFICIFVCQV